MCYTSLSLSLGEECSSFVHADCSFPEHASPQLCTSVPPHGSLGCDCLRLIQGWHGRRYVELHPKDALGQKGGRDSGGGGASSQWDVLSKDKGKNVTIVVPNTFTYLHFARLHCVQICKPG